ncbi:MAG: NUDIX hydrolase [Firmicutes bacterium]|nr:NUDIX hydrolase [Bacillota bacterium]
MCGRTDSLEEKLIERKTVHNGKILTLNVDRVALPGGGVATREVVLHPGAAAVVALDDAGNVLLVEQYRYPAGATLLEIPAGKLDPGEDPLGCARRELGEEAGVTARDWERLGSFFTSPGFSSEVIHVFLASGLEPVRPGEALPDDDELLRVEHVPLADARDLISNGRIRDAKTVAGLLLAMDRGAFEAPRAAGRGGR